MKKKILITGSSGFLGNLAKEYFGKNYDLVLVDLLDLNDANFYKADISIFEEIDHVITKEKPHIIFHLHQKYLTLMTKKKIYKTNVEGSLNVQRSAIKNNVENLIFHFNFLAF